MLILTRTSIHCHIASSKCLLGELLPVNYLFANTFANQGQVLTEYMRPPPVVFKLVCFGQKLLSQLNAEIHSTNHHTSLSRRDQGLLANAC